MARVLFLVLVLIPSPGPADEVSDGQLLFRLRCSLCHGESADDGPAGDLRGLPSAVIRRAVGGFEAMPKIPLAENELTAILDWLGAAE
jgi:mono/diheme cytochrome c family protein